MKTCAFKIAGRPIGSGCPVYIIAEISANHAGSFSNALRLIDEAKKAGADCVKFQVYTADTITIRSEKPYFKICSGTLWDGRTMHDLYGQAHTPWQWFPALQKHARKAGIDFFASAFDPTAVDFLEKLGVPAHKSASFEIVDIPLIEKMARTHKPLILSTGMATEKEISEAVAAARRARAGGIALLKCTSAYPAPAEEMNLKTIAYLEKKFAVPVGISDHTPGIAVPVAAVAMGAALIEKHLMLSKKIKTPDSAFSLEPAEFRAMVEAVRFAEKSFGKIKLGPGKNEKKSLVFRRSLFVVADILRGEVLTEKNVRSIRPSHGLPPKYWKRILGRKAVTDIEKGTPLSWRHFR